MQIQRFFDQISYVTPGKAPQGSPVQSGIRICTTFCWEQVEICLKKTKQKQSKTKHAKGITVLRIAPNPPPL